MNPLTYALKRIRQQIPREVLNLAFKQKTTTGFSIPVSVDSMIREQVINDMVLTDCNLTGGAEVVIHLRSTVRERVEPGVHVYRIPKQLTQNRKILSALSLSFSMSGTSAMGMNYGTNDEVLNVAKKQMASNMAIEPISDARCSVIGENVIMAEHADSYIGNVYLRCIIENDANMNHLNPKSWDNFGTLCVWAAKSCIYVNTIIDMDRGYIVGGSEIGQYKTTIENYSDANETYRDYLKTTWAKTAVLNDPEMRDRFIRLTSGQG